MSETHTASAVVKYTLDETKSTFTVQAFAAGLLAGFGHNPTIAIRNYSGEAQCIADSLAEASVRVVVQAKSLVVTDDVKEKDRREIEHTMLSDVLEVHKYPEVVFQSTNIVVSRVGEGRFKARIVGDLTLHGETRRGLWIQAFLTTAGDEINARGDFTLKQTDYGIKLVSVAAGALKLKDELKFTYDLVGVRVGGD